MDGKFLADEKGSALALKHLGVILHDNLYKDSRSFPCGAEYQENQIFWTMMVDNRQRMVMSALSPLHRVKNRATGWCA